MADKKDLDSLIEEIRQKKNEKLIVNKFRNQSMCMITYWMCQQYQKHKKTVFYKEEMCKYLTMSPQGVQYLLNFLIGIGLIDGIFSGPHTYYNLTLNSEQPKILKYLPIVEKCLMEKIKNQHD